MPAHRVFISYSHRDEEWTNRLLSQLGALERGGLLEVWHDRRIRAGEDWHSKIQDALGEAAVAVMLISADFLCSAFIHEHEVPRLLERRQREGLKVVPVLVRPCPWQRIPWLAAMQFCPPGARPLSAVEDHEWEANLVEVANEILELLPAQEHRSPAAGRSECPELLPFLVDRDRQDFELGELIRHALDERRSCPLVCVVHGDELQGHEMYLERVRDRVLRRLLALDRHQRVEDVPVDWPSRFDRPEQVSRQLLRELGENVLDRSFASADEVNQAFARIPGPVVVHTYMLSDDWQVQGPASLDTFLDFWRQWPELAGGQRLIVFLFFKYRRGDAQTRSRFLRLLLRREGWKRINHAVAQALAELDFGRFQPLVGRVLPRLEDVTRSDAENWARQEAAVYLSRSDLLAEIRSIFERWQRERSCDTLPMVELTDELRRVIEGGTSSQRRAQD